MLPLFATLVTPATAAVADAEFSELENICFMNVATGEYLNFDYGKLKNGTALRVWERDGSPEQLWDIKKVGDAYRILTAKSSKYCVDVYRGSSKLKAGQKCDIWRAGDDSKAQNVVFYQCGDGSYIIRMKDDPSLALSAAKSGERVTLAKFSLENTAERWVIKDADGRRVSLGASSPASYDGIPADAFIFTGAVYTVEGVKYYRAKSTREYNGVKSGTFFFTDREGRVVTDGELINKLSSLVFFSDIRLSLLSMAESYASVADEYYEIYTDIAKLERAGTLIGKGSGLALGAAAGNPFGIEEAAIEVAGELLSPGTVKAHVLVSMLRVYSSDAAYYGSEAARLLKAPVTDYDNMARCMALFSECTALFAATEYLADDSVREMAGSNWFRELGKYFKNVVLGFADAVIPDIPAVVITKYATDGVISLYEFAEKSGAEAEYRRALAEKSGYIPNDFPADKRCVERLASCEWESLVGKTVAGIKSGSKYTGWYNTEGNVSARGGYTGQCTWYALGRFFEVTGINLGKAPNANKWLTANKSSAKVKVVLGAESISAHSVAVDTDGKYGHVLFIEHVEYAADGTPEYVYFTECNMDGNGKYNAGKDCIVKGMSFSEFLKKRDPEGYIRAK